MPQAAAAIPIITAATAGAGVGLQIYGTTQQQSAAKKQYQLQQDIAAREAQAEAVRQRAAELDAHRRQLEIVRVQNRQRALALANATAGGAQYGSGLQGGYGQIAGQTHDGGRAGWNRPGN